MYSRIKTQLRSQRQNLTLSDFSGGLVTSVRPIKLKQNELSSCVNFKLAKLGGLETRLGLTKYNTSAFPDNIISMSAANIDGINYNMFACEDNHVYYLDGNYNPTLLSGTLNSTDVQIIGYNDVAIILDGGTIKYWDGTGGLKLAYDDGTGVNGYQFDNSSDNDSGATTICSGLATRVAYKFTSTDWDSGWTINPTKVTAKLSKTGSPTGNVEVKIRKVSDDSILATKTFVVATTVTSGITAEYSTIFSSGDIINGMSSNTEYYCSIEYTGGDSNNYIDVHYTTITANGHSSDYDGSWTDSSVKDPIMSLKPGAAPKALFGDVMTGRLYVAGDSDNYGYVRYSNLTHLDWSTPDGGGYIGAVDDGANSFAVGAIMTLYGDLYIFGKESQPYLAKLTGSSPSDYTLPPLFQRVSATHKTLVSVVNNLFFCSEGGVDSLRGVEQYGDLRTFSESDAIKDIIDNYWDNSAFSGYNIADGQYWLKLTDYSKTLVCHTKQPNQKTGRLPWVEYRFFRENLSDSYLYEWHNSFTTGEFYVTAISGINPNIEEPSYIMFDDNEVTTETLGSLVNNTWCYGDNDSLGFDTIYVSLLDMATVSGTEISVVLEPTTFGSYLGKTFVAGDDKNVYYMDLDAVDDNLSNVKYEIATAYFVTPFAKTCLERDYLDFTSETGGRFDMEIYTNNILVDYVTSETITLSAADNLTVDDLDAMLVQDAAFDLDVGGRITNWINLNCRSFLFRFCNFSINGKTMFFNSMVVETRKVSR